MTPDARREIIIEKRKWDGSVSARWSADFERHASRATWRTPRGTHRAHPWRGLVEITELDEVSATDGAGWVATAIIVRGGGLVRYEVDATLGGEMETGGVFAFVDLDLDLEIDENGEVVRDLIEFAERGAEMGYPAGLLHQAIHGLDLARARYRVRDWPFDGTLLRA